MTRTRQHNYPSIFICGSLVTLNNKVHSFVIPSRSLAPIVQRQTNINDKKLIFSQTHSSSSSTSSGSRSIIRTTPLFVLNNANLAETTSWSSPSSSYYPPTFETDSYLEKLSKIVDGTDPSLVGPEEYINSLSQFVSDTSTAVAAVEPLFDSSSGVDFGGSSDFYFDAASATSSFIDNNNIVQSSTSSSSHLYFADKVPVGVGSAAIGSGAATSLYLTSDDNTAAAISSTMFDEGTASNIAGSSVDGLMNNALSIDAALPIEEPSSSALLADAATATPALTQPSLEESLGQVDRIFDTVIPDVSSSLHLSDAGTAIDAISSTATIASEGTPSSLASQLSGLSYDSIVDNGVISDPVSQPPALSEVMSGFASNVGSSIGNLLGQASKSMGQAGASLSSSLQDVPKAVESGTSKLIQQGSLNIEGTAASMNGAVKDKSLSDLAHSVVHGIDRVASSVYTVTDTVLHDLAGSSMEKVIANVQVIINGIIDGAQTSAINVLNDIGSLSLSEAIQLLVSLIITVTKVLFTVLNAIIKVASGKSITAWAVAAAGAVQYEADKLIEQALAAASDLSHKSIGELTSMVGHFSEDVGRIAVASVEKLSDSDAVVGATSQYLAASADSISSLTHGVDVSQMF